jgi:hypothetical protein
MADTLRALTPAAARRIRAEIAAERELRERGIEACSHFPEGDWDREVQIARRRLHRRGLLRPDVPVSFPF